MESNLNFILSPKQLQSHRQAEPSDQNSLMSPQADKQQPNRRKQKGISRLLHDQPLKKVTAFLKKSMGRNFPIHYKQEFNFIQNWQATHKQASSQISIELLCGMGFWINFATLPIFLIQIWLLSIFRVFQYHNCEYIFIMGLIGNIISILYTCIKFYKTIDSNMDILSQLTKMLSNGQNVALIGTAYNTLYDILMILNMADIRSNIAYLPFDIIVIAFYYIRVEKVYSKIRIKAIGSTYKHFMHLFDLGSNVLILIHIFSILIFLCTYYNKHTNWLSLAPFEIKDGWQFDYIYSFYFACTTMLTVGYGDFRPTNQVQILCILLVQIFGIVSNGYAISQIGSNLTRLRSSRQTLQSDLSNAEKLATLNAMEGDMQQRLCEELISNKQVNEELSLKEEQSILTKLNDELREQICVTNQINIVKTSLFILANFGKRMQIEMSKRMIKVIYPPNTTLLQIFGKQKIFVLAKGTLQIVTERRWKNRNFPERLLKVMQKKSNNINDVYKNVYGYSALLSAKPSRIKAVSKAFTVCYTLQHQDILDFIIGSNDDFERYHAMKIKYHLTNAPQSLEIAGILSSRQHYAPNIFLLIRAYLKTLNKVNKRKWKHNRSPMRCRLVIINAEDDIRERSGTYVDESETLENEDNQFKISPSLLQNIQNRLERPENQHNFINKARIYGRDKSNTRYQELRHKMLSDKVTAFIKDQKYTESYREYKKYLPNGNITTVLTKNKMGKMIPSQKASVLQNLRIKQTLKQLKSISYSKEK